MSGLYQIPGLFLTALCHVTIFHYLSDRKYPIMKNVYYGSLYMVCFVLIGSLGLSKGGIAALFSYAGVVVCSFLYSCIISQDIFLKKSFLFITYFGIFSILDNCMKILVKLLFPQLSVWGEYYVAIVLRSAALLFILALYLKFVRPGFHFMEDTGRKRWWNLALIALIFYLLQAALGILNAGNVIPGRELVLMFAAVSFVMCAVYGVVFSNISYMKKDAETALIRQNAEYLSNRLSVLQNAEEANRRLRHDMRHHIETIAEYAKAGDTSAILAYIGEYRNEISEAAVNQYSVNSTINMIFSAYAGKAKEGGIRFLVSCDVPEKLAVRDIDLIALLGNLLENALHGCQKSGKENPCIKIRICLQSAMLLILCDNTCPDDLELADGLPASKSIGISSILAVCGKYGGSLDYKVENDICSAGVVLNL